MDAIPTLRTERLVLRPPVMADYPAYAAFVASDRSRLLAGHMSAGRRAVPQHEGDVVYRYFSG